MNTAKEIQEALAGCYCSEQFWRHPLANLVYTEGIKRLAEMACAWWLVDAIASYQSQCNKDAMLRDIQFWKLRRVSGNEFVLTCERDKDDIAITQRIEYSDFPMDEVKIWVENQTMMLPIKMAELGLYKPSDESNYYIPIEKAPEVEQE